MYIEATGTLTALAVSLAVAIAPNSAQPTAGAMEQILGTGRPASSIVEPSPAPVVPQGPAASHNVISQPPVCRIRADDECYQTASACLTARSVGGLYGVDWREGKPAVVRNRDDLTEADETHARACATDLQICLSGNC
ncbi:MAG: hypothetical protein VR74_18920 [Hyphomonas sp. BRH_c22]|uniref:hypothetical protein n=1 Tax=Hyphomonas sp. BRH_c22 TaxID=1629710 RepID=UPI0005F18A72|nr:hypothetical protein [Hyphomonas sp. BRH_c22]KJS34767.1 MAG: hypothetical protein VR74_18920 [Hyphomonas sp. BRH_c22]